MKTIAAAAMLWPGAAEAACRLALVLALDVSGSVDAREYVQQLDGTATALTDPEVRGALLAVPGAPVHLAAFEWSSSAYQRQILGWTAIATEADLDRVAATLRGWRRAAAPQSTGIGAALLHAGQMLRDGPACWRQVIDISGDGRNNGLPVQNVVKATGLLTGVTVNALVVGPGASASRDRDAELAALAGYFRTTVLHGPDAFVEIARGYDDYADAMTRKLLREITARPVGAAPVTPLWRRVAMPARGVAADQ